MVATLMGHAKVDTTLNVYTQVLEESLRGAVEKVGCELITIDHESEGRGEFAAPDARFSAENWLLRLDSNQQPSG